ncbi:hypothetical protein G7048_15710 [Diaphorobacter sp. HDW4B]|uniref:hypothetical protein n=1 Tax=Diaphorobacter sp. HDW4B TaxID=2714925 RepID=UPI001407A0B2|nr:hypothetical protein [Diaphorobacter sp. HDW4B]QIL71674.1 hypothetical protein G7048_15710 [Diaphorobacter sp. HDW4B]
MMTSLPPMVAGVNAIVDFVNAVADYVEEGGSTSSALWGQVSQGVADVQAALAAIQNGPVQSINGRSGVVTGLVEAASSSLGASAMSTAPLGQWSSFNSSGAAGADWPTTQTNVWWNVLTLGASTRRTQIAVQTLSTGDQGGMYIRSLHDATWSGWQRYFGDQSLVERAKYVQSPGAAYYANPAEATLQYIDVSAPLTVYAVTARKPGDQMTLMFSFPTVSALAWSSNVKSPAGGIATPVASHILTVPLIARQDGNWQAYDGGLHPW